MIRVLIVDDEPLARDYLASLLATEQDVEIVGQARNGLEAVELITAAAPDLVFLDVQMPELNGFEVLEQIGTALPAIVFVTAYDAYAIKAFDVHALDYLLKPFDRERFGRSMARARSLVAGRNGAAPLEPRLAALLGELEQRNRFRPWIVVKTDGKAVVLRTHEIDYLEAAANYVRLFVGKTAWQLRETMSSMEAKLDPERFQRIHRSTIVNLDRIRELEPYFHGDWIVKLHDGRSLTLSRTYREKLASRLGRDL